MATLAELEMALRNADKAGDMDAARRLAAALVKTRQDVSSQFPTNPIANIGQENKEQESTIGQKLIGVGEAGLSALTGLTGGTLGQIGGTIGATAASILNGDFGTPEAADLIAHAAEQGAQQLTYAPRTKVGQQYVENVGEAAQQLAPLAGLGGEMASLGAGVQAAKPAMAAQPIMAPVLAGINRVTAPIVSVAERAVETAGLKKPIASPGSFGPLVTPEKTTEGMSNIKPMMAVSEDTLRHPAVRARPSDIIPDMAVIGKRDEVLDAIGIPADQRRLGAQTGNRAQIQNEVMIGKLAGADRMKQQFAMEADKLGDYATAIQRDTGGTVGANMLQRGEAISAPLEGYQQWYTGQIKQLYKQADEAAAQTNMPIKFSKLEETLSTASEFAGKAENAAIRRGLRAYLKEQGIMGKDGDMIATNAMAAEKVKQYLNGQWSPQNKGLIGKLKGQIDDDVLAVLPSDIYKDARSIRRQYSEIFEDPKGLAKILDISGPEGVNRAISLDVLPDTLATWAARNSAQFKHVIGTLENLPTPELQTAGRQAIGEVKAHLVEKMLGRNIDQGEAALGGKVTWKGTDDSLQRAMAPYRGKLEDLLGKQLSDRMETLKIGARILRPYDPNPSGTATTSLNLQSELAKKAITGAGGAAGAAIGGITGGPVGATGGAVAGATFAKKIIDVRQQQAIDRSISKSLDVVSKQKRLKEMAGKRQF